MKKVAAETAHEGGPLALSTKFLVEEVAPLAADIKDFNSLDCAVKCPRRAEAVRLGAPDRIMGIENAANFVSYIGAVYSADGWLTFEIDEETGCAYLRMHIAIGRDNPVGAETYRAILGFGDVAHSARAKVSDIVLVDGQHGDSDADGIVFTRASDIASFIGLLLGCSTQLWDPRNGESFMTEELELPVCLGKFFKPAVLLDFWHLYRDSKWEDSTRIAFDLVELVTVDVM